MANKHQPRGTGKGTNQAWRKRFGIEGEPEASNFFTEPGDKASKAEIIDLHSRKPIEADTLHVNPAVAESDERTSVYRTGPTWETDVRKPLPEKSAEEQLAEIEAKIKSKDFSETEREFFETMVRKYPGELRRAKEKIEKRGGTVNEKWANVIKISYIGDITRAGLKKDRWGDKIPLASEKAELLEKYLELKLPVGIPEEKPAASAEKSENVYSGEKSSEFLRLLKTAGGLLRKWFKESEEWGEEYGDKEARKNAILEQLQIALPILMAQDLELKKYFSEKNVPAAVERAMNYVKQFNNIE